MIGDMRIKKLINRVFFFAISAGVLSVSASGLIMFTDLEQTAIGVFGLACVSIVASFICAFMLPKIR